MDADRRVVAQEHSGAKNCLHGCHTLDYSICIVYTVFPRLTGRR
jgi:hypothetical protein